MLGSGKSDPAKDKQRELDDARERRGKHNARLEAQLERVAELRSELEQAAAAAAPDAALDKAEAKVAAAERRVETLRTAIATSDREIADCEAKLAAILDGIQRSETASALDVLADDTVDGGKLVDAALGKLVEVATRASAIVPEAAGVAIFAQSARRDLPAALELVVSQLRGRARGVLAGHGRADLPQHPAPAPAKPPLASAQPQSAGVFATKPLKWRDDRGQLRTHPAWFDVTLPVDLAARAIELGAAVNPQHEIAKASQNARRDWVFPDPAKCIALNDTGEPAPAPEAARGNAGANGAAAPADAQFTPLDRGKSFQIAVQGPLV